MASTEQKADRLSHAKTVAQQVLDHWPPDVDGADKLEMAIGLLGECEGELDDAAEAQEAGGGPTYG